MIGYKATDMDGCCRGFKFEVGKTYTKDTKKEYLKCCTDTGFHFCRELLAIERESNYKLSESRLFEVIAGDVVRDGDKYCTNSITILREIEEEEKLSLINTGYKNTGNCNTGNKNTGNCNTGNKNTGDWNTGNWNTGNRNTGYCNTGDWNTGNKNTGDWNTGNKNTGYCNTGNWNTGNRNTGYCNTGNCNTGNKNTGNCNTGNKNTGDWNTGDWNTGDWNTGDWNTGDWNTGYFNTKEPFVRMFNKDTNKKREDLSFPSFLYFDLTVWVSHDTATDEEKEAHKQEIEVCGGFLKKLDYKEAFRISWNKASLEEHKKLLVLPNWDNDIFKEISGIDAEAEIAREEKKCGRRGGRRMTREELEKEAEEYGLQKALWCPSECGDLRDAFKDGAEFGYNKANEWHYVKDGDLPNNQRIVEVFTKDKDVFIAYIDSEDEEWSVGQYFRKVLPMNDVIAWKEIVLPKENEFKTEMFPKITLPKGSAEFVDKVIADAEKRLKENE